MQNPSNTAINELYLFLESGNLPITEDGHFLAYKKVKNDYYDIYSGNFNNAVGQVLSMPRNQVNDNRKATCSRGLHFCSFNYLKAYNSHNSNTDRIMIVKINPKDVVSIPNDYNNTKGRTERYEVIGEVSREDAPDAFTSSVDIKWDDSFDDYEDDDYYNDDYEDDDYCNTDGIVTESLKEGYSLQVSSNGTEIYRNASGKFVTKDEATI
jgi:hypothetical protein